MKSRKLISAALALCMAVPMIAVPSANAEAAVKYGDANADTAVDLSDMITMTRYLHGRESNIALDLADINRDKNVDSLDLVQLRKMLLKSIKAALAESSVSENSRSLTAGITASAGETVTGVKDIDEEFRLAHSKFALDLLKNQVNETDNVMISPYSVMQALGMLANGASGDTLDQLEKGMGGIRIEDLNKYLKKWRTDQPDDEYCKLSTANSIWARDNELFKPRPEFIQTTASQYNAEYYLAPFDTNTLNDINSWVNDKTDEMIPKILDDISQDDIMYIINAVAFDAKWESPYEPNDVRTYNFTNSSGKIQKAEMLCKGESYIINDDNAKGFYKYYKGKKYAFTALLPDENITVTEYINSLTPEHFSKLFAEPETASKDRTMVRLPKFKYDYQTNLKDALSGMGMKDMFNQQKADFPGLSSVDRPYVDKVIHDTFIQLDEDGTKAAAVTAVIVQANGIMMYKYELNFDRPFVYAIVDTETDMPVFVGTLMSIPE